MYQISKVPVRDGHPEAGTVLIEQEHRVMKLLGYYPAGPLNDDDATIGAAERRTRERKFTLVKFVARDGGTRCVRVADLTVLG